MERADGKAAGDDGFITCQRIGLADGARPDAIPNAAGGEGGHGAATPDVATHRYSDSHLVCVVGRCRRRRHRALGRQGDRAISRCCTDRCRLYHFILLRGLSDSTTGLGSV
jgi:hypothetical protein